jgi:transposase
VGGLQVKFRAIADFRVKFDEEISQVFSQSVSVLKKRKQTVGVDIKVDGTKIKANAADDQTYTKEELVMRHEKLENEIREYLRRGI